MCAEVQWTQNVTYLQGHTHNLVLVEHVTRQDSGVFPVTHYFSKYGLPTSYIEIIWAFIKTAAFWMLL